MNWQGLLGLIAAGILVWFLYRFIRSNPQSLTKKNFQHTATTLGWLGIGLIAFISVLVWLLRHT